MTETVEDLDVITEALAIIDRGLGDMLHRELVSTDEVANLLLDVRLLLTPEGIPRPELSCPLRVRPSVAGPPPS